VIRATPDIEPDGPLAVIQTLQQWGIEGIDWASASEIFEALRVRIPESRPLFPDTLSTLKVLGQRGFLLGIVTNRLWGGEPFQQDLRTLGLLDYFEPRHMAISADLGVRKPNSAIFLHALNALEVEPRHAAMVGDSLQADMVGALSLGIFSIWKPKARVLHEILRGAQDDRPGTVPISTASRAAQPDAGVPVPDPSVDDPSPASPPTGMYATDDDIILASIQKRDEYIRGEIQPDLVIERLSDLLDVFLEVGVQ
jgi:HAD superfamily hydrolase (TIGR01549 family)